MSGDIEFSDEEIDRFWAKVAIKGLDDCWEWQASTINSGYGMLVIKRRHITAHRFSWMLANDTDIPDGLLVLHSCDNKLCCNPAHLRLGTHSDNIKEAYARGLRVVRDSRGEKHGGAKLTEKDVLEIRRLSAEGKSYSTLAGEYGVSKATIAFVVTRRKWGWLK